MRYLGEVVLGAAILVHCFNLSKSYSFTFGNCGFAGSKPIGIAFSDTSGCNATVCDLKCINGYYVEGGPLQCVNGTWSSLNNVYCEEECASNLSGIIDFVTANSSCASNRSGFECPFQCQAGYTPSGSATCEAGTWYNASCLRDCDVVNDPPDMDFMIWNSTCGGGTLFIHRILRTPQHTHSNFRYGSFR